VPGNATEVLVNGARLRLDSVSRSVATALGSETVPFDALCARLPNVPRSALVRAVLDLAQHEVVRID
jgi:hypothetical protein